MKLGTPPSQQPPPLPATKSALKQFIEVCCKYWAISRWILKSWNIKRKYLILQKDDDMQLKILEYSGKESEIIEKSCIS